MQFVSNMHETRYTTYQSQIERDDVSFWQLDFVPDKVISHDSCASVVTEASLGHLEPARVALKTYSTTESRDNCVKHQYHDFSQYPWHQGFIQASHAEGSTKSSFPLKLYKMLEDASRLGFEDIISWQPHGRAFRIHHPGKFINIVPIYFGDIRMASFQRQLSIYGFKRLYQKTADHNAYYHERFLRGRPDLRCTLERQARNGNQVRKSADPKAEPDFYAMSSVDGIDPSAVGMPQYFQNSGTWTPEPLKTNAAPIERNDSPLARLYQSDYLLCGQAQAIDLTPFSLEQSARGLDMDDEEVQHLIHRLSVGEHFDEWKV